ncbi:Trk system potassium uptake protein TrkA [Labilithrix luteola]|uniref:Trk system potassium uptake protein TrkA n=1 Tax=Labilithrix luteola TaxID=1391654 RepID=A0A0K1Q739_9BACT|nr:NAD-binding protein [Labilithrix luteola]AKV01553.1 Trk system potassium uptake protein TrkA [Labilithrix luteola]
MRIVIAGAGRGGLSVAIHLQSLGHVVTILDRDAIVTRRAFEENGIVALAGDATDVALLAQAEVGRADAVLAMLHRDADNLAVAMLARRLGALRVMVRMRDPEYRGVYDAAGVHQIISETEVLVGALATAVEHESVRHSMALGNGEAIAFEIEVPEGAWVVGRTVSEVAQQPDFPRSCVIAGMSLDGAVQGARGASMFAVGTQVLLVAARNDVAAAISFLMRLRPSVIAAAS